MSPNNAIKSRPVLLYEKNVFMHISLEPVYMKLVYSLYFFIRHITGCQNLLRFNFFCNCLLILYTC